jgi:heat shock protein HtpX
VVQRSWRAGGSRIGRSSRAGGQAGAIILVIGLILVILGPIVARIVFFAASRTREYLADAGGAIFTRNPGGLADALEKISANIAGNTLPVPEVAQGMLIVGPALFESHPPIERRIAILRKLAGGGEFSYNRYAAAFREVAGSSPKFIPTSALEAQPGAGPAAIAAQPAGQAAAADVPGAYRREALDAVKKKAGYKAFLCACGATIKVPPKFPPGRSIKCPGCRRSLDQCVLTPLGRQ